MVYVEYQGQPTDAKAFGEYVRKTKVLLGIGVVIAPAVLLLSAINPMAVPMALGITVGTSMGIDLLMSRYKPQ